MNMRRVSKPPGDEEQEWADGSLLIPPLSLCHFSIAVAVFLMGCACRSVKCTVLRSRRGQSKCFVNFLQEELEKRSPRSSEQALAFSLTKEWEELQGRGCGCPLVQSAFGKFRLLKDLVKVYVLFVCVCALAGCLISIGCVGVHHNNALSKRFAWCGDKPSWCSANLMLMGFKGAVVCSYWSCGGDIIE